MNTRAETLLRNSLRTRQDEPAPRVPATLAADFELYYATRAELREMIALANTAITHGYTVHAQAAMMVIRGLRDRLRSIRRRTLSPTLCV